MKRFSALFLFAVFVLVSLPTVTSAASLYIDPGMSSLNRGDSISMKVRLDTDEEAGECVNAADVVLTYSDNIEPVDISIGSSIFNMWVEKPTINKVDRTITFAGGIPNGYCGRVIGDPRLSNILTEIIFRSPGFTVGGSDSTTAVIEFTDASTAYLNDGRGTKAKLTTFGSLIELSSLPSNIPINPWKEQVTADDIPPEEFSILLQKDEKAFSRKWYIIFNTSDKQTGIDHYEVIEEPLAQFGSFKWGRADAPWLVQRSPYILNDQSLNSVIRVKAIDKAGNEYIATIIPDETNRSYSTNQILTVFVSASSVLILLTIIFLLYRLYRSRKMTAVSNEGKEGEINTEDDDTQNQDYTQTNNEVNDYDQHI
ncbi:MAG: hypothetical protein LR008_00865 [Candidatus Pacebacteria bacterium]|nr:hypothetical protein [Candidatus Paceibacterota bacterium]